MIDKIFEEELVSAICVYEYLVGERWSSTIPQPNCLWKEGNNDEDIFNLDFSIDQIDEADQVFYRTVERWSRVDPAQEEQCATDHGDDTNQGDNSDQCGLFSADRQFFLYENVMEPQRIIQDIGGFKHVASLFGGLITGGKSSL